MLTQEYFLVIACLSLVGAVFVIIPQSLRLFEEWKRHKKSATFGTMVLMWGLAVFMLWFGYKICLDSIVGYLSSVSSKFSAGTRSYILPISTIVIAASMVYYSSIYSLKFFHRWKISHRSIFLSTSVFLGTSVLFWFAFMIEFNTNG